jgi:hypothetical protein
MFAIFVVGLLVASAILTAPAVVIVSLGAQWHHD